MDDLEKQSGALVGGMTEIGTEGDGYRHRLTLVVSIVTEPLSNPLLN